jgi:hypothetical protein
MAHPPAHAKDAPDRLLWLVKLCSELLIALKKHPNNNIFRSLRGKADAAEATYDTSSFLPGNAQRVRLTFARSISCVARPSRTAFIMNIPK